MIKTSNMTEHDDDDRSCKRTLVATHPRPVKLLRQAGVVGKGIRCCHKYGKALLKHTRKGCNTILH